MSTLPLMLRVVAYAVLITPLALDQLVFCQHAMKVVLKWKSLLCYDYCNGS